MRDDPSQKIIGVSASGFCLKERLGNLRNVIDQNSDEMRIAMIAMQDEQFAHQTFMSELCNHKHFFSNQFRPCHRIDFKAPYSTFQCQMTQGGLQEAKTTLHSPPGITQCIVFQRKVTIFHFHIKTCQTVTLSNELSIYCLSIYISHAPPASSTQKPYQNHSLCPPSPIAAK